MSPEPLCSTELFFAQYWSEYISWDIPIDEDFLYRLRYGKDLPYLHFTRTDLQDFFPFWRLKLPWLLTGFKYSPLDARLYRSQIPSV